MKDFWYFIFEKEIKFLKNIDEDTFVKKQKYFPKNGKKFEKGIFEIKNFGKLSADFEGFKKN